jgi:serine/threonine-protein kinase HipA
MPEVLKVLLGERPVGTIVNLRNDRNQFHFDPTYVEDPERPTLSLGFYDGAGQLSAPTRIPHVRLLPFFSNLLPEGHLRQYLADRARINPLRDFPLLWQLGEDLPGAVVVRHPDGSSVMPESLTGRDAFNEDPSLLKFSLAGVQLKFSAIMETDGGLTIPAQGRNGHWIVKMPSAVFANVPENEFAMLGFARAVGIEVPDFELVDSGAIRNMPAEVRTDLGSALAVRRFDRVGETRIHIEDFNQIYNQYPSEKYENVSYGNMLGNIWGVMGEAAAREFIRRLIFSIGIGNADMHLKNWSVVYADGKTPTLAPAYDYVSTVAFIDDDALALTIARTKQWSDISYDRLERMARKAAVPPGLVLEPAREMVERMRDVWPGFRGQIELPDRMIARIDAQMDSVPIFGPVGALAILGHPVSEEPREIA